MNTLIQTDLQNYLRRLIEDNLPEKKSRGDMDSRSPAQNKKHDNDVPLKPDQK